MWSTISKSLVVAALTAWTLDSASAIKVLVKNQCVDEFILSHVAKAVIIADPFMPGSTMTKEFAMGTISQVFKAGTGAQATLAEITVDKDMVYLDISIIPTGEKSGPKHCMSLQDCKDLTGGVGYNVPMQIIPSTPPSRQFPGCNTITCMYDGCPEAYHFPDDTKTHVCGPNTDLEVIFCPGGPGRKTDPPTPPPTTPAPMTPAPTTPAPTTPAPAVNESLSFNGSGFLGDGSVALGEDRALDVDTPVPVVEVAPVAAEPQTEVQEVTTRSSNESSTGPEVYVLLSVGAAAAVAASAIFVLRKKKQALEALDDKTPRTTTAAGAAFVLSTPQESTVL